ncbi:molybdenum cofactor biosynthesis protein MoaE [Propionibacteriaceae bacterium Y2011]|uniref:molybdenum cofactor biosynthesis protein MoaE n=1 Tax=Microlunatus sp. Y2014 TaxID=3418488 RepID=UPI003B46A2C8
MSDRTVVVHTAVVDTPLLLGDVVDRVTGPSVGGLGVFVGVVRDNDEDKPVRSLDYTAHPTAAEELAACVRRVTARHDVWAAAVEHRIGHLAVGDLAVVVAVGAGHRGPALECCRELIDTLKVEVPIWKEQTFDDGAVSWVGA